MQADESLSLEQALDKSQTDAESAIRASAAVTRALKRFQTAVRVGNLRDLEPALLSAEQALVQLLVSHSPIGVTQGTSGTLAGSRGRISGHAWTS